MTQRLEEHLLLFPGPRFPAPGTQRPLLFPACSCTHVCLRMQRYINKNKIFNESKAERVFIAFALRGKKDLTRSNLHKLIINKLDIAKSGCCRVLGITRLRARFMTQSWGQSHLIQTELLDHGVTKKKKIGANAKQIPTKYLAQMTSLFILNNPVK